MEDNNKNDDSQIKIISSEDVLDYDLNSSVQIDNINSDYRNSNYKYIKIYFEEIKNHIVLKQDWRLGKGGILWDGVGV